MENELVSIITPMYNGAKYVSETIESVLAQTYTDWEMLIVNDGSKDNGPEIVEKYAKKDSRIRLINQENGGSANARNHGIREARGRYIALLDSDDVWESDFLEEQLKFMKENNAELVYSSHKRIDENGKECLRPYIVKGSIGYKDLLRTCSISCLTGLYDTKTWGKIYLREELNSLRDDYVYWLTIIKKTGIAYGNEKVLASYRILGNSASRKKKKVIKPQYKVYREIEKLDIFHSLFYLICWAYYGYMKYHK